jgi:hypothetical protein
MVALSLVLGGTAVAASTAKHKDAKADTKLVKKLAPSLSVKHAKTANSATSAVNATNAVNATSAANATHATTADSATSATNAANATNATNAANLGGVPASSYLTNSGSIFIASGVSNWVAANPANITWTYFTNASNAASAGAATEFLHVSPSIPTGLYGKALKASSMTLCYSANANAKIIRVIVSANTYSNADGGIATPNDVVDDATNRTDTACRSYAFSSPVTLTSLTDINIAVNVTFAAGGSLYLGQSGITLSPTTTAASTSKNTAGRSAGTRGGDGSIVTHN